jgi:predicted ATPase
MNLDDSSGNEVGRRGEFAPLLYGRTRTQQIANEKILLENSDKKRFTDLESQFGLWMCRLFPGFQARTENLDQLDSVILGLNLQRQIGEAEYFRPGNVGFGVSFALPVILAGLLSDRETTLIVENPEAHLHPSAQSLMGEFLTRTAAGGAQVFVETHSDHVVNGMRIALKNDVIMQPEIRFFAFSKTEEYGSHRIIPVALNESGDFALRPDSFFDQTDKDLKLIYGIG